jgi:triosephosphate isomerase
MRRNIVAGNWKMNKKFPDGINLIREIKDKSGSLNNVKLIISPPYIFLNDASNLTSDSDIKIAAQNCSNEESGAFTGEISTSMLKSANVSHVILGHSERRAYYGETDELINQKIKLCIKHNLIPIVCCGEVLEERESDEHFTVVSTQLKGMFNAIAPDEFKQIIIAYEPVWAIGTGKTASPDQAQEMHQFIRKIITDSYGLEIANDLSILYGGSCKPSNAKELFANADVDGGLIGGASLNADDFLAIAKSF